MEKNNQITVQRKLILPELSQKLMLSLVTLESEKDKFVAKTQLNEVLDVLVPQGKPQFLDLIRYPKITDLIAAEGKTKITKCVFLLIKDFCASLNVVRNMNEDQMIDAAMMLIREAGNFRLEDYTIMFDMAKRGELVKIMDRVDINIISTMLDEYWLRRHRAAKRAEEESAGHQEALGPTMRMLEDRHPMDAKMIETSEKIQASLSELRFRFGEWKEETKLKEENSKSETE